MTSCTIGFKQRLAFGYIGLGMGRNRQNYETGYQENRF
jgi:hypothetical protein